MTRRGRTVGRWRNPPAVLLDMPRPTGETVRRRLVQILVTVYLIACVICVSLVVTAAVDDWRISSDRGTATAEVVSTGKKTLVRFPDAEGNYHSPGTGLKYPGGLEAGDRVKVEYRRDDPDNVKVAGRGWTLSLLPAASTWLGCTVVAGALLAGVGRSFRRGSAELREEGSAELREAGSAGLREEGRVAGREEGSAPSGH